MSLTSFQRDDIPEAGGAIFAASSTVDIKSSDDAKECKFSDNSSPVGGALALSCCDTIIKRAKFTNNTAYFAGGAIYVDNMEKLNDPNFQIYIFDSNFENNTAGDDGGAIACLLLKDCYIDNCGFMANDAKLRGGAIFSEMTKISIFDSKFDTNTVGKIVNSKQDTAKYYDATNNKKYLEDYSYHFRGRGGAAIYFQGSKSNETTASLYTQNTCFRDNQAYRGTNLAEKVQRPGHHLMFDLSCKWNSYNDAFVGPNFEDSYAHVNRENTNTVLDMHYLPGNKADCPSSGLSSISPAKIVNYARISNIQNDEQTSSVPNPSSYTYVATPITKLPQPTTESYVTFPTTSKFSTPATKTSNTIPSPTPTIEESPSKVVGQSVKSGYDGDISYSSTVTVTQTIIFIDTFIETLTETTINNNDQTLIWTFSSTIITKETFINIEIVYEFKKGLDAKTIILIAVLACVFIINIETF